MKKGNMQMITKLVFRLLWIQILLAMVGSIDEIISSYFASNYVGIDAMSAVGLYNPINMLMGSCGTVLAGGSAILCGKYLGANRHEDMQNVFSLDLLLTTIVAGVFIFALAFMGLSGQTGFLVRDPAVQPYFNRYLLGQAIGIFPQMLSTQLPVFLSIENKGKRSLIAGFIFVVTNFILNLVFVKTMHLESFGIALSSSIGMWVIMLAEIQYFFSGSSSLKVSLHPTSVVKEGGKILAIGFPGAASNIYQTIRGLIVNGLLSTYVGSMGISAFAGANNVMGIFWAIPGGMLAVSRLLISVSAGEEDRQTLSDIIRIMFTRYLPIMLGVDLLIILAAPYLTMIFFRDPSVPVYGMMVDGLRILPLCMCFSIICMHFTCLGQTFGKQGFVNILALLDGVVCVAGFSFLLIAVFRIGIKGVYIANVLNGVVTTLYILGYAWMKNRRFPKDLEELMVLPDSFGVTEEERIDVSVRTMDDVVTVSDQIQTFCRERGIDEKRSYLAGLAMEEMAGNVVAHGFRKDAKKHSIDIRVVHKDERVILRIKDDCVPFDPKERRQLLEGDILKNIGIRMIYDLVKDIDYQNMLGLNVLTMTI